MSTNVGKIGILACAAAAVLTGAGTSIAGTAIYNYTSLGTPTGTTNSYAADINNYGDVVGYANSGIGTKSLSWEYSGGTMSVLPTSTFTGEQQSAATGINDSGTIIGDYITGFSNGGTEAYAYEYSGGVMSTFAGLNGGFPTYPFAINSSGAIVGTGYTSSTGSGSYRAFENTGSGATALATLEGGNDSAQAINSSGYVAGIVNPSTSSAAYREAAVWSPTGTLTTLGYLAAYNGASLSKATGINKNEVVVGASTSSSGYHAFLWTQTGGMQDLGSLGGGSYATAINDSNTIVGYSHILSRDSGYGFVYFGGTMYNLNDLVAVPTGWSITQATAINNLGDIVGYAYNSSSHTSEAILLTPLGASPAGPLPVPASIGLVGVGSLALLGGVALRRRLMPKL